MFQYHILIQSLHCTFKMEFIALPHGTQNKSSPQQNVREISQNQNDWPQSPPPILDHHNRDPAFLPREPPNRSHIGNDLSCQLMMYWERRQATRDMIEGLFSVTPFFLAGCYGKKTRNEENHKVTYAYKLKFSW